MEPACFGEAESLCAAGGLSTELPKACTVCMAGGRGEDEDAGSGGCTIDGCSPRPREGLTDVRDGCGGSIRARTRMPC
eukprot:1773818-Amphidinium_carterae.1